MKWLRFRRRAGIVARCGFLWRDVVLGREDMLILHTPARACAKRSQLSGLRSIDNPHLNRITSPPMRSLLLTLLIILMTQTTHADTKLAYPPTRTDDVIDTLHGVAV